MESDALVLLLHISDATAEKLRIVHDLDPDAVRLAVVNVRGLHYRWDHDPERGSRMKVFTDLDGEVIEVVLYPSRTGNAQEWHLGSAYPVDQPM